MSVLMSDPVHASYFSDPPAPVPPVPLTDDELRERTQSLIDAAKNISVELMLQTERLATTIDTFNREVIEPMRQLKGQHDD